MITDKFKRKSAMWSKPCITKENLPETSPLNCNDRACYMFYNIKDKVSKFKVKSSKSNTFTVHVIQCGIS